MQGLRCSLRRRIRDNAASLFEPQGTAWALTPKTRPMARNELPFPVHGHSALLVGGAGTMISRFGNAEAAAIAARRRISGNKLGGDRRGDGPSFQPPKKAGWPNYSTTPVYVENTRVSDACHTECQVVTLALRVSFRPFRRLQLVPEMVHSVTARNHPCYQRHNPNFPPLRFVQVCRRTLPYSGIVAEQCQFQCRLCPGPPHLNNILAERSGKSRRLRINCAPNPAARHRRNGGR